MTEISQPWDGTAIGDAVLNCLPSEAWTKMFREFETFDYSQEGILPSALNGNLRPSLLGATVTALDGNAINTGTFYCSDTPETFPVPVAGATRIDRLVLRKSWVSQTVRLTYIVGVGAVPPPLVQILNSVWDIPIAQIEAFTGVLTDERRAGGRHGKFLLERVSIPKSGAITFISFSSFSTDPIFKNLQITGTISTLGPPWIAGYYALFLNSLTVSLSTNYTLVVSDSGGVDLGKSLSFLGGDFEFSGRDALSEVEPFHGFEINIYNYTSSITTKTLTSQSIYLKEAVPAPGEVVGAMNAVGSATTDPLDLSPITNFTIGFLGFNFGEFSIHATL